ncbi:MAG: Hsp20/alpha crystallin family protein [Planctomycetes bacterium]|nr:Hsp20/alpha crystallin family protein [Planctomycetota bacterium]MCH9727945.1 Hsp20/alpha crystallin family protein [Planctomycetota bacterium]MCH9778380.1 Hsp20/alpha crystallin family protein [Planctomycetota bacterium]MCH9791930.1 Hsp20/alpha crystallin family protein [Planctomycetota bacterium]MDF1742899.1 Hsp20/alpha crystallin family protein [Gimesia sp.]
MSTTENQADPVHVSTEEEAVEQTEAEQSKKSETSGMHNSIERLRSEFDKLLGVAVEQGERALDKLGMLGNEAVWIPRVDLLELEEQVQVSFDLPGVTADEINITLAGNMLTITGTRETGTTATSGQTVRMSERPSGIFRRSVPMPIAVDPDQVTATVQNGVVTVMLEKSSTVKPRQIPIKSTTETGV